MQDVVQPGYDSESSEQRQHARGWGCRAEEISKQRKSKFPLRKVHVNEHILIKEIMPHYIIKKTSPSW